MSPWAPRCPCGSTDVAIEAGFEDGFEERLETTHRCQKCHRRFRITPPAGVPVPKQKEIATC
jgi:hypothetical protein